MSKYAYITKSRNYFYGLQFTTRHNGKMKGIVSLSTSVTINPICIERRKDPNSICSKCFAAAQMKVYKQMNESYTRNFEILNAEELPEMPRVDIEGVELLRGEAFGDYASKYAVLNLFNWCKANPEKKVAAWTKNLHFFAEAIKEQPKPENLNVVFSSKYLNKPAEVPTFAAGFVDRVFTVYDKEHAQSIDINCGARSCNTCRKCYNKTGEYFYINELLKYI